MTPTKPRLFLVVLATTVASQDGVVAAGDSVRNCRTRPSAEQRLLPDVDHPIPGKCEPRFTLATKLPARPGGGRNAGRAGPRVAGARRKRPVPAPSRQISLVTSASSVGPAARRSLPQSRPGSSPASFLCLPTAPPSPFLRPRVPTRRVLSARREKQASRACVPPHLSVGRRERKTPPSVPRRSRQGRGQGDDLFPRVELNPGGFLKISLWSLRAPRPPRNFLISGRN